MLEQRPREGGWVMGTPRETGGTVPPGEGVGPGGCSLLPKGANLCGSLRGSAEKATAPHSSTLAWKLPWTEERGRMQSMESLRVRHD